MTNLEFKNAKKKIAKRNAIIKTAIKAGAIGILLIGGLLPAVSMLGGVYQPLFIVLSIGSVAGIIGSGISDYKKVAKQIDDEYIKAEAEEKQKYQVEQYVPDNTKKTSKSVVMDNATQVSSQKQTGAEKQGKTDAGDDITR